MRSLPEAPVLAKLFSDVTNTMLGISFKHTEAQMDLAHLYWRSAVLNIGKDTCINVALASDEKGCQMLGAAMFQCKEGEVDESMVDDTLRELVNITAGMVKRALGMDQLLGLPRILSKAAPSQMPPPEWKQVLLAGGGAHILMFVSNPHAKG